MTQRLSKDLHTRIEIKRVDFSLFNHMHLQGVLIEDQKKDTILSAGEVRVRITDWFFFKKNIVLKYIGLENAVIKMQRDDATWNHQFFVDYFSSPSSGKKTEGGTQLSLEKVELKNISFLKRDAWLGQDMTIAVSSLNIDTRNINFNKKTIDLGSLKMVDPYVSLFNYQKLKPAPTTEIKAITPSPLDSALNWNEGGWVVKIAKLEIENGTFKNNAYSYTPTVSTFDGRHIEFAKINGSFTNTLWEKDTVTTHLVLQTKERSGFEVKNMNADVKLTPQEMAFSNLDIQTTNSIIRDYFRMSYDDISSMNDFIHKVKMQANFNDSEIDSDDIAFFAPEMSSWKKNIQLKGAVRGTVDDIVGKNLVIQAGNNTLLNGDISMTGLPDINQTFIDFRANDFRTTYEDAASFVPEVRRVTVPNLRRLQFLRFNGSFTGFIRDFVTYGTLQTNLGIVKSDLNMKLPVGKQPIYSGMISTDYFKLGDFIGDANIGAVALNGSLKGKGFSEKNRMATIDGKILFADYKGYRYDNITLNGELDKKRFEGDASIDDEEAKLTLNGEIDFNSPIPLFNFFADVQKANLKKLNLTRDDISFGGKFNLNFSGSTIDNFLGSAVISEASLTRNGNPLPFDSLIFTSEYANNVKTLRASSNEFEAIVTGDFTIRDLPDAFKLFLNKYYPAYIKPPRTQPENQSLKFDITTLNVDSYIKLIDSSLAGFNNSHIFGSLDTRNNRLNLTANVPQFQYGKYIFNNVDLEAIGNRDSLVLDGSASNINVSDSLNIPVALFHINAHNDISKVQIHTGANQAINQADLNAQVLTYNNGVKIEFDPSSFIVNGKTWTIEENGELEFRRNIPASGQLVLRESNQEVRMRTRPSEIGDWNDLVIELKKVNAGDFAPFLLPQNRLEGLLSGDILIEDPINNPFITADNLTGEGIRLDNDSLGNVKANLVYDNKTKQLKAKGTTVDNPNSLAFDINLFLANAEAQKNNLIALKANNFQLKILERFLGNLFSDIQGYVTGDFELRGPFNHLDVTGKGRLKDAGLKVNFTQCFYKINDTDIELKKGEINLDGIVLTDPATGNPIYLVGNIQHDAFKKMFFGLTASTLKPNTRGPEFNKPVLLLNTGYNDNKQFYGRVKGTGSFSLSGYQSDLYMKIDAIASATDSSTVTIPSSKSRESGIADFLVERKYGREMTDASLAGSSNITYDVDVTANPMVTVRVVLDDLTGDEIKGRGAGSLNIHSGTTEKLTMRGRFDIEEGNYLFTFQSFFKKPFEIRKGTENYISWTGDPYAAKIKFEAVYTAENVSFSPLVNALNFDPAYSRLRDDVYVVAYLSGDLFKPDFRFSLDFPSNSKVKNDFAVAKSIELMQNNTNDLNRQVTYLIVFNSFAPPESGPTNVGFGSTINELTYNTISSISGLFFNEINKKLNSELSKILKTDNISINFSGSVYNRNLLDQQSSNNFNINQSNFNVNVPISMFKDRFVVTLGSTLDVPLQSTIQQNVQFLPDVTAEWLINQSGTIRASFFYRQNLDYLTTSTTGAARTKRSGASISYRKEFETLREFFRSRKKREELLRQKPSVEATKPEEDDTTDTAKDNKKP
ncbi:translocation/assembly module TamB domain-containing protein [Terrimonas alba]|uniref:translocation/assembly module TamB domain-containing protein n=1 Tax=Terrimonas alba TaxID=3349636 RepID=UPI0035F41B76